MMKKALTLTELLISIAIIVLLILILLPALAKMRDQRRRTSCANNLSQIGKAMHWYCNDYDDDFPRAAGPNSIWGTTPNWQADDRRAAFALDSEDTPGRASISASLYLLVKYEDVPPKSLLCKGDIKTTEFIPAKYGVRNKKLIDLWDFGPDPTKHCSFSYHIPYGPYSLTSSNLPGMAVTADRNPWLPSPGAKARNFKSFNAAGDKKAIKAGNTIFHQEDGQNVLYIDAHVSFERRSFCSVNDDNIYTYQNAADIQKGAAPTLTSQPANRTDSVLLHDPPRNNQE